MPKAINFKRVVMRLTESATRVAEKERQEGINTIAETIRTILRRQSWGKPGTVKMKILAESYAQIREAVTCIDATHCLREHAFAKGTRWLEFHIPQASDNMDTLDALIREVKESLRKTGLIERGFVYVVWSLRPREFFYIGKAQTVDRLGHGKFAYGSAYATRLSLIFPAKNQDAARAQVEASLLAVIKRMTNGQPEQNKRKEPVPAGCASRDLDKLAHFMTAQQEALSGRGTKQTTLLDAAVAILRKASRPMSVQEIVGKIRAKRLWRSEGKTPTATLSSSILREIQDKGDDARFIKVGPGRFALK